MNPAVIEFLIEAAKKHEENVFADIKEVAYAAVEKALGTFGKLTDQPLIKAFEVSFRNIRYNTVTMILTRDDKNYAIEYARHSSCVRLYFASTWILQGQETPSVTAFLTPATDPDIRGLYYQLLLLIGRHS